LDLDPRHSFAYFGRGQVLARRGHLEQAVADLTSAIEHDSDSFAAYHERGNAYLDIALSAESVVKSAACEKAIADFTKAIRLAPNWAFPYAGRATACLVLTRKAPQVLVDLAEAIRLAPKDPAFYRLRADLYRSLGDEANAARDERRIQELGGEQPAEKA
jgi:tetratricopeptide (TPR) repeat protein